MAEAGSWVVASLSTRLGREIINAAEVQPSLELAVTSAPRIASAEAASITIREGDRYRTAVSTDDDVIRADQLQYELGEGPCVDATAHNEHYVINDVANDPRWPRWGPKAANLGIGSVLAVHVLVSATSVGALNLYNRDSRDFGSDDICIGYLLADQVGVALAAVTKLEHLAAGMDGRTVIGQAQGILMQRYDLDSDRAWQSMVRQSQNANIKVRDLAQTIIRDRALPGHASQ